MDVRLSDIGLGCRQRVKVSGRHIANGGLFSVGLDRNRDEFVTDADVEGQTGLDAYVILKVEPNDTFPPPANIVGTRFDEPGGVDILS